MLRDLKLRILKTLSSVQKLKLKNSSKIEQFFLISIEHFFSPNLQTGMKLGISDNESHLTNNTGKLFFSPPKLRRAGINQSSDFENFHKTCNFESIGQNIKKIRGHIVIDSIPAYLHGSTTFVVTLTSLQRALKIEPISNSFPQVVPRHL